MGNSNEGMSFQKQVYDFSSYWFFHMAWIKAVSEHCHSEFILADWQWVDIYYWTNYWLSELSVDLLNIPNHLHNKLEGKVSDFINEDSWCVPLSLQYKFPQLIKTLRDVSLPPSSCLNQSMWSTTSCDTLSLKEAYGFLNPVCPIVHWCSLIWQSFIPPSRSLFCWRLMHNKLPPEENLRLRGCNVVSICRLCYLDAESTNHCFFIVVLPNLLGIG